MRFLFLTFILFNLFAEADTSSMTSKIKVEKSIEKLLANIHPEGTVSGIVVASPSKNDPGYFFHWARDAALVMNTVFDLLIRENDPLKKNTYLTLLKEYALREKSYQDKSTFFQLGEPKYNVDGELFTGPWGRPQHDGPGLRSITLIRLANYLLDQGEEKFVREHLYSPTLPAFSVIKRDLEYVARKWNEVGFDYWEEIKGLHFSTAMSHRKALLLGSELAKRLNDSGAADFYQENAKKVKDLIQKFWNSSENFIAATINQQGGFYKSHLDVSVILGVLHSSLDDDFYSVDSVQVLQTALKLEQSFKKIYTINHGSKGVAIGRYPEDTYDGYKTDKRGNPWFLATFAMAEYYLKLAARVDDGEMTKNKLDEIAALLGLDDTHGLYLYLRSKAYNFIEKADYHAALDGSMSEQMNRENGYMQGARDLTWSYASHISMTLAL